MGHIYEVTIRTTVYSDVPLDDTEVIEAATSGQERSEVEITEREA